MYKKEIRKRHKMFSAGEKREKSEFSLLIKKLGN